MGKVYLATDPKLQRTVAIKVLASDVESPEMRERFRLEVRAVAALKHPNIVELYDYSGEDAKQLYFVMEHVPGFSLFETTRLNGCMPEITALCVGHELAQAMAHAHSHSVVHRDIKPENVLLNAGRLVVTDFGIVKAVEEGNALGVRWTNSRTRVLGTPGFMAPEQFAGHKIDYRTDLFGVGAVLYNLTTGHVPYEGGTVEHIYKNLKSGNCEDPRAHLQSLTPEFCTIVAGCIAPKPGDRYADANALKDAIRALLMQRGVTEIRDELRAYEANPKEHRRNVTTGATTETATLLEQLRNALAANDTQAARAAVARLNLAPPAAAPNPTWGQPRRRFLWGFLTGCVAGVVGALAWHLF